MRAVVIAMLALTAEAGAAPGKLCTSGSRLDAVVRTGETAIVCDDGNERACWRIDAKGLISVASKADWPAVAELKGDRGRPEAVKTDYVDVSAPAGIKVTVSGEAPAQVIEVCKGERCRKLRPKQRKIDDVMSVTVMGDGHSVFVGIGVGLVAPEQLLRFDLDNPGAGRPLARCASVIDELGGNALIQKTDCANYGGSRMLVTPAGKILGIVGESFGSDSPWFNVGGNRWLFYGYNTFTVWDVAKGTQLASVPVCK